MKMTGVVLKTPLLQWARTVWILKLNVPIQLPESVKGNALPGYVANRAEERI